MELRSKRIVDGTPIIRSDFDLMDRAASISEFDGFTARNVRPHANPHLAVELLPAETYEFDFPTDDSGSEYQPDSSDSDSSDGWEEPLPPRRKRKAAAAVSAIDAERTGARFNFDGAQSAMPASYGRSSTSQPSSREFCVEVPLLSARAKALYHPPSHHASLSGRNGRDVVLDKGRVIRMAPERVDNYKLRRALRKAQQHAARLAAAAQLDVPRPAKAPRLQKKKTKPKKQGNAGAAAQTPKKAAPARGTLPTAAPNVKSDAKRERRRRHRQKQRAQGGPNATLATQHIAQAVRVESKIDVKTHVTGKSVFTAPSKFRDEQLKSSTSSAPAPPTLHPDVSTMVRDLVDQGALYVAADDRGIIMTDSQGRIYCAKPPTCQDPDFLEAQRHCGRAIMRLNEQLDIRHEDNVASTNTRGNFNKVQVGTSFGGGQTQPTRFSTDIGGEDPHARTQRQENNRRHLARFMKDKQVRRVVKHMQTCAENTFPEVMEEYRQLNDDLGLNDAFRLDDDDDDDLDINYYFAAMTFNLGPQVATIFHRDAMNLQQGICVIMAFGKYNPKTSGHFIMKEPNVVLEFAPGDILFVMSALITHGNAPLKAHEYRASWTFYTAGGLFRWRAAGCRTLKSLSTDEEKWSYLRAAKSWCDLAWANLLTVEQLTNYFSRSS